MFHPRSNGVSVWVSAMAYSWNNIKHCTQQLTFPNITTAINNNSKGNNTNMLILMVHMVVHNNFLANQSQLSGLNCSNIYLSFWTKCAFSLALSLILSFSILSLSRELISIMTTTLTCMLFVCLVTPELIMLHHVIFTLWWSIGETFSLYKANWFTIAFHINLFALFDIWYSLG